MGRTQGTFVLDAQQEILGMTSAGRRYPAILSTKLISIFDVSIIVQNTVATIELQTGDFHRLIEILPPSGGVATDVDDILKVGGLPITKVEGVIRIERSRLIEEKRLRSFFYLARANIQAKLVRTE